MTPWNHQTQGVKDVLAAQQRGERSIVLTSPTGGGKTFMMGMLIEEWIRQDLKVVLYTNRRLLVEQLSDVLSKYGLIHGVRAAGYPADRDLMIQVSSFQTEHSRVMKKKVWSDLHQADRVLIDEAHMQKGDTVREILDHHHNSGAFRVGVTATPLDLEGDYDLLIQAGTNSELRACGALVRADVYGPDEPDLEEIRVQLGLDLSEREAVELMMRDGLFGRVMKEFHERNPDRRPTLLFAPGVEQSLWFAQQFELQGISAAHVDAKNVWMDGELQPRKRGKTDQAKEILHRSKKGEICVIANRFVLREGVDAPWISHGILATVFGSLLSYLQAVGRLLRRSDGKTVATISDHGGNWWRHGSPNSDRVWDLRYTDKTLCGIRQKRLREGKDPEPARCPQCNLILVGTRCSCGFERKKGQRLPRPVVQSDGSMRMIEGPLFRQRQVRLMDNTERLWEKTYFRARNSGMTFHQAMGLFVHENHYEPPQSVLLMPKHEMHWFVPVKEVPLDDLTSGPIKRAKVSSVPEGIPEGPGTVEGTLFD